jgi:hypothetical protein
MQKDIQILKMFAVVISGKGHGERRERIFTFFII